MSYEYEIRKLPSPPTLADEAGQAFIDEVNNQKMPRDGGEQKPGRVIPASMEPRYFLDYEHLFHEWNSNGDKFLTPNELEEAKRTAAGSHLDLKLIERVQSQLGNLRQLSDDEPGPERNITVFDMSRLNRLLNQSDVNLQHDDFVYLRGPAFEAKYNEHMNRNMTQHNFSPLERRVTLAFRQPLY